MSLDPNTLFVVLIGFCAIAGAGMLAFWRHAPEEEHFAYWGVALLSGALAVCGLALRGQIPGRLSIDGANLLALLSFSLAWIGMRSFSGRRPDWPGFMVAPIIWLVACLIPAIYESLPNRVFVASLLSASIAFRMLLEVRRNRDGRLPGSTGIMLLCAFHIAAMLVRAVGALQIAPGEDGTVVPSLLVFSLVEPLFVIFGVLVCAIMMSQGRRELALEIKASTDPLTGILNRGAFMETAARKLADPGRGGTLALVLFDIDFFKEINDGFGHAVGDRVLVAFAEAACGSVRSTDLLGRIGGEEFALQLDAADHAIALAVIERVRSDFERRAADIVGPSMRVTVSAGVAFVEDERSLDQMMLRADAALYAAKRSGRDAVRRAGDPAVA